MSGPPDKIMGLFSGRFLRSGTKRWFKRADPRDGGSSPEEPATPKRRWANRKPHWKSSRPEPQEPPSREALVFTEWRRPGVAVTIEGLPLTGPLYLSTTVGQPTLGPRDRLAIDPELPISPTADDREGRRLGPRPRYPTLEPGQRRTYLEWIAGRRRDPQIGDGYILLQLYAIEYRALVELEPSPSSEAETETHGKERAELARLLERLHARYGDRAGCGHLLANAGRAIRILLAEDGGAAYLQTPAGNCGVPLDTHLAIAQKLATGRPLNARDLFLYRHTTADRKPQEESRLNPELRETFRRLFRVRHKQGWKPSRGPTGTLRIEPYEAASGDFQAALEKHRQILPDPTETDIGEAADALYAEAQKRLWPLRMHLATGGSKSSAQYARLLRAQSLTNHESTQAHAQDDQGVVLDESRLSAIEVQSDQAASILSRYFQEDGGETAAEETSPEPEGPRALDHRHQELADRLQNRTEWSETELREQARTVGLRAMGAVEVINEWWIEHKERPLLILDSPNWIVDPE